MSSRFSLDDYVDVAERIRQFNGRYPEGSLQSELTYMADPAGWLCVARAYRTAADERPGVGHAFEPVPGKTPYTRDSEAQNAETAAWGRAIVALGFETKKIASKQEVKARQSDETKQAQGESASAGQNALIHAASAGQNALIHAVIDDLAKVRGVEPDTVKQALKEKLGVRSFSNLPKEKAKIAIDTLQHWHEQAKVLA